MSKNSLRIKDYLEHIKEALERIERYTASLTEASFLLDELVQDAVIRNIEILGEAANNIKKADTAFTETHADIPWLTMYAMRDGLAVKVQDVRDQTAPLLNRASDFFIV